MNSEIEAKTCEDLDPFDAFFSCSFEQWKRVLGSPEAKNQRIGDRCEPGTNRSFIERETVYAVQGKMGKWRKITTSDEETVRLSEFWAGKDQERVWISNVDGEAENVDNVKNPESRLTESAR